MAAQLVDTQAYDNLNVGAETYAWQDLCRLLPIEKLRRLPYSLRILLENVARCTPTALPAMLAYLDDAGPRCEVPFKPNRLMLHDTTCLPALADLAGMRDAVAELGGDPSRLNPSIPVVLTIDHSMTVEHHATADAVEKNQDIDFRRNSERYRFIKWAQQNVRQFSVVPPGTGIIHQINMESLAQVVSETRLPDGARLLHPDCMVATDSHTPMINALGVMAWGVGGVEGQAAMLGEPVSIVMPKTVGLRVEGKLRPGVTGTDLALHLTSLLRRFGVVSKFVEICGEGVSELDWGTRATVANMAPEYGATVVYFPFDEVSLGYLKLTGREPHHCERVAAYMRAQHLWRDDDAVRFDEEIRLDLAGVGPSVAGPCLPQQRLPLAQVRESFQSQVIGGRKADPAARFPSVRHGAALEHGAVAIAAITSCTNTSNPKLMIGAALLARNARRRGLQAKPWVKTSFSPGSRTVIDYLKDAGLMPELEGLGFHAVGFGCMTCIGSSGPLEPNIDSLVDQGLLVAGVLSGNRNFEGRVHPKIAGGYLASPPLVVAYAIAGTVMIDLGGEPVGGDASGKPVLLRDLWPAHDEVEELVRRHVKPEHFAARNKTIWLGTEHWRRLRGSDGVRFGWEDSTYLRRPAYTEGIAPAAPMSLNIRDARTLVWLPDDVTTDHISPAGTIPRHSAAGQWLLARGQNVEDLNQYSTRRSNHEVMLRGAFTTPNLKNLLLGKDHPTGMGAYARTADGSAVVPVFDAAGTYTCPLVIFAGANYGAGSSRDWAAKAPALLGVRVVVARSFERIHRSNLIGMGVFPIELAADERVERHITTGGEVLDFNGLESIRVGRQEIGIDVCRGGENSSSMRAWLRIDSEQELAYLHNGGILPYVVRKALH